MGYFSRIIFFIFLTVCLIWLGGLLGLLDSFRVLGRDEFLMLGGLGAYAALGLWGVFRRDFPMVSQVSHDLPILALVFTGLGLLLAINGLRELDQASMTVVFKQLGFAISPNVLGVGLMFWFRALCYWVAGERI